MNLLRVESTCSVCGVSSFVQCVEFTSSVSEVNLLEGAGAERHFAMMESLDGAAAFLLGHVARPDVANGSLRITGGRSSFHDMTKMLPGTFVEYVRPTCLRGVPSFQLRKAIVSLNTCTFNGIPGCPNWPIIPPPMPGGEDEHFSLAEMDAIVEHAKLEMHASIASSTARPSLPASCARWMRSSAMMIDVLCSC